MRKLITILFLLASGVTFAQLYTPNGAVTGTTTPSGGNVGIGTNAPQSKLEVSGGKITVSFTNTDHVDKNTIPMIGSTFPGLSDFGVGINTLIESAGGNKYGMQFITREGYSINPSAKMTVLGNGNVGIGTNAPQSKLEVSGGKLTVSFTNAEHIDGNTIPMIGSTFPGLNDFGVGINTLIENAGGNKYGMQFITREGYSINPSAKMTVLGNGNVGVGTTTPTSEFQVNNGAKKISLGKVPQQFSQGLGWASAYIGLNLARSSEKWIASSDGGQNGGSMILGDPFGQFRIVNIPSSGASDQYLTDDQIKNGTRFIISPSGNVGIGLGTIPRSPLEVRVTGDNNSVQTGLIIQQTNPGSPNNKAGVSLDFGVGNNIGNNNIEGRITLKETYFGVKPKMCFSLWDGNNAMQERMVIDTDGNVGIGTTTIDAKLAVKGSIHTQEVKVDLQGSVAPDYVFEKDYNLISLPELETYLKQNKHLPEVPSAKEFEAEGMKLKEMNLLLLKKVEELTLYMIEQQKVIGKQNERITKLENTK